MHICLFVAPIRMVHPAPDLSFWLGLEAWSKMAQHVSQGMQSKVAWRHAYQHAFL